MQIILKRLDAPNAAEIPPRIHYFWRFCEKTWVQNEVKKLPGPNRQLDDKKSAGQLEVFWQDPARTRKFKFGRVHCFQANQESIRRIQPEQENRIGRFHRLKNLFSGTEIKYTENKLKYLEPWARRIHIAQSPKLERHTPSLEKSEQTNPSRRKPCPTS